MQIVYAKLVSTALFCSLPTRSSAYISAPVLQDSDGAGD